MKIISQEEIPGIHHRLANESEELGDSGSTRKKRSWGFPDPDAKVVALSPAQLQDSETFMCDFCDEGFSRIQNLKFHLRKHEIDYKLPKKDIAELKKKKVYICPDSSCIHHNPARALNNITAVKRHYNRKHNQKSLICNKCSNKYAWKPDLNAHRKKCGTKNYECGRCGLKYLRIDHFEIHKAKCQLQSSMSNKLVHISEESMSEVNNFEIHKAKCQLQSSMSNELVHISEESMSEVNNVQVPPKSGPSSTPFKNKIDQNLKLCDTFGTSKFIESDQVQPIDQMFDYSHEHSLHVYSCLKKSIWELTYWDLI
ncbi:hypothetical protein AgCh_018693 [Apium graveolens]